MAGFSIMLIFFLVIYLGILGFAVLSYVFNALGMYTIAKRRGINNPWLAWVPIGSSWLLGSISDQYHYVVKGEVKSKRKILLGLQLGFLGTYLLFFIGWIWLIVNIVLTGDAEMTDAMMAQSMMAPVMLFYVAALVMSAMSIVLSVFQYMALYDLYRSCDPDVGVLFLVLSILFGVAQPFFVFGVRKKDKGMPPRREQTPAQTVLMMTAPEVPLSSETEPATAGDIQEETLSDTADTAQPPVDEEITE